MRDSKKVCQFCRHWRQVDSNGGVGPGKAECHFHPPNVALINGEKERVYPVTFADDDCSFWEQQTLKRKRRAKNGPR